jgi:hypothetical protein
VFPDLDHARLKRSFEYFADHYAPGERIAPGSNPVNVVIADFVEGTQDFCGERVAEIDRDLEKRGAYTLSFLREYLTRDQQKNV